MSARTLLADALRSALPGYRVIPAADVPDKVTRTTLLLHQGTITRAPQIAHNRITVDLVLWVLVANEQPEAAEAALEKGVDDVIEALRPLIWVDWPNAERMTFGEPDGPSYHGYRFNLTATASIGA